MADGIQIDINASWKGDAAVSQASASLGKLSGAATSGNNSFQSMATGLQGVAMSAVRNASIFASLGAAVGIAAKQVYNFGKAGAEIVYTAEKFDRLSVSVGSTSKVFLDQLRTATKGTLSDFKLLQQGSSLLQLGLASDSNEAVRLSRVMSALGMNTNELTLALANQSKRRLDQLGLSLTAFNKIEDKLKDSGMTKEQIFKEAFLQTAEQTVMLTGNRADSLAGDYERISAATENMMNMMKETTARAIAPDVKNLSNILMAMNAVQRQDMAWTGNIAQILFGEGPVLRRGVASDFSDLWAGGASSDFGGRGFGRNQAPAQVGLSALQSYTAMAYAGRNLGGAGLEGGAPSAAVPIDYALLLEGSLKATVGAEKYSEAQNKLEQTTYELNQELAIQEKILAETSEKYGETHTKTTEQAEKVNELKKNIEAATEAQKTLADQYTDSGNEMLLTTMQNMGATDEQMLRFAASSGIITHEAAQQQKALMSISDALMSGKITGDQASAAVAKLMAYDGKNASMVIDIYINYIIGGGGGGKKGGGPPGVTPAMGDIGLGGDAPVVYTSDAGGVYGNQTAKGGPLTGLNMVGERGWEYVVQDKNGNYIVIPHEASVWMERAGIMPENKMYTGGILGEAGLEDWTPISTSSGFGTTGNITGNKGSTHYGSGGGGGGGGSGSAASVASSAILDAIPEITAAVGGSMEQTMAASPQLQALAASVAELKSVNETLVALLEKTASAGDIGRAVTGDMARQA